MERLSKETVTIKYLMNLAQLSKCKHGKCAAILTDTDYTQIYSIGINGGPSGQVDCACNSLNAKYGCAHAEQNCLVKNANFDKPKIMLCTKMCCPTCATLIINSKANIKEFHYIEDFSDATGLEYLSHANIKVVKIITENV
jgi:deoxycytidylate deaminase